MSHWDPAETVLPDHPPPRPTPRGLVRPCRGLQSAPPRPSRCFPGVALRLLGPGVGGQWRTTACPNPGVGGATGGPGAPRGGGRPPAQGGGGPLPGPPPPRKQCPILPQGVSYGENPPRLFPPGKK